ncbi:hypothetical protein R1flu_015923 [Riccia fluitans]|uniref:EF-hand domain-containing protein n=1 Tax=Riccia fluitans TaxID=41844 RepID=A0ABD1YP85_9MARC
MGEQIIVFYGDSFESDRTELSDVDKQSAEGKSKEEDADETGGAAGQRFGAGCHSAMGQLQSREKKHTHIRLIIDKVFDHFTAHSGSEKLTFHELYTAILLVYNDINKKIPGPHHDPPSREEVRKILETFDTNQNGVLDRNEFAAFLEKFTSDLYVGLSKNVLIFAIGAPLLAMVAKRATEQVPTVGPVVKRVPNFIYASLITTAVAFLGQAKALD